MNSTPAVRSLAVLGLAAALFTSSGCRSFEKDWAAAAKIPVAPNDPLTGRWIGTWQNTNNAHGGALRAIVPPASGSSASKRTVRYHAVWGTHNGSFTSPLLVETQGDGVHFTGSKWILGFQIKTEGEARNGQFNATYHSAFDNGTFTLRRVPAGDSNPK